MENKNYYSKIDTKLAKKRTMLAANRTFLSHIRTSLVFISVALAFLKIEKDKPADAFVIILFVLSGLFFVLGIIDYYTSKKMINTIEEKE